MPDEGNLPPTVSVVIPTHNRPELMTRAVRSVIAQQWDGPIDIVVVFDASEVFVPEVDLPTTCTLRVMENLRSRGLAGARNTGIEAATGSWVAFLDDDDVWQPGKLRAQFARLAEGPEAIMCVTGMSVDNGRGIVERPLPHREITLPELIRDRVAAVHSSSFLVLREELMGRLGLVDEDLPRSFGEDYDLLIRASRLAPIAAVTQPQITATWKGQSLFARNWPSISDALQHLLAKHPEFGADPVGRARIEAQIAIAEVGRGSRDGGRDWVRRAANSNRWEKRIPLARAMVWGWLTPEQAGKAAHRLGRGV